MINAAIITPNVEIVENSENCHQLILFLIIIN